MRVRWPLLGLEVVALVVPAVTITGARLLGPTDGRWIRLVALTPCAAVLYAAALALLLVDLVAGRRPRVSGSVALLVLPLVALHVLWASERYVGQVAAVAGLGRPAVTVMTVNLSEGQADAARVVELAVANDAHVLVLVEVTPRARRALQSAGIADTFAHRAGTAAAWPPGTVVFSRHLLTSVTRLPTTFACYRMTMRLRGEDLELFAVHLFPPLQDARRWRADHRALRAALESGAPPTVVAGDFNSTPDHEPMRALAGRGLRSADALANEGWQPTWPAAGEVSFLGVGVPSLLKIDHVLSDASLPGLSSETATVEGTDHRALVARLARR